MKGSGLTLAIVGAFFALCVAVVVIAMNKKGDDASGAGGASSAKAISSSSEKAGDKATGGDKGDGDKNAVEILVSSSDGKKEWLEEITKDYRATVGGKPVKVKLLHMKSGESLQNILDGKEKPVVWSPASGSWIELLNTTWTTRTGHAFLTGAKPSVMSPMVLATWEPMAKALGWPQKPIGWEEIFKVALDPKGWASVGHPEWGAFRFGHGHPDYSTSAMLSVISSIYAASGKTKGLLPADVKSPKVMEKVGALEKAIVHYGESSSWLTEKLCTKGPAYLSAVPLYEASVVSANDKYKDKMPFRLVAVYPKEGTFWEDHPTGVVDADWVTAEKKEAATAFVTYMTAKEQQARAVKSGYRPTDPTLALTSPIDEAHGADVKQTPASRLEYVSEDVFKRSNELWHQVKKHSTVFLLLDISGSMQGKPMNAAKKGAAAFVRTMEKSDEVGVMVFSTTPKMLKPLSPVREVGEGLASQIEGLFADGQTSLYDASIDALSLVEQHKKTSKEPRLYGVVLLSDGKDTSSKHTISDLMELMPATEAADGTRLFTVAYGDEADKDVLKQLANRSNARYLEGTADNIEKIYHQISAYF